MNWLILAACLCLAGCQAAHVSVDVSATAADMKNQNKGFVEWVINLLGGTTTTARPVTQEPDVSTKECPMCQCGVARTKRRIVGGSETNVRQYPWMVMLLYNGRMFCGGSLINDLYVLTASHCTGFRKERMTVRLLEHDVTDRLNDTKIIDRKVVQIIRHMRYNPGTYDNDISMLKLDKRVDLSNAIKKRAHSIEARSTEEGITVAGTPQVGTAEAGTTETVMTTEAESHTPTTQEDDGTVRPVCLPQIGHAYTGHCGLVIGWGTTEQGGSISNTLQEVKVPIVSNQECRDRSYGYRVTENMLCAGQPEGGHDACQGDSGGPLHVFNETTGRFYEVGVVSWGEGCAQPSKYGVYSRVNRYLQWIKSNTKDACYCDEM